MSGAIIVKNLKEVLAAIDGAGDRIEQGAQIGIAQAGLEFNAKRKSMLTPAHAAAKVAGLFRLSTLALADPDRM